MRCSNLSIHWSIRGKQLMSDRITCLQMLARDFTVLLSWRRQCWSRSLSQWGTFLPTCFLLDFQERGDLLDFPLLYRNQIFANQVGRLLDFNFYIGYWKSRLIFPVSSRSTKRKLDEAQNQDKENWSHWYCGLNERTDAAILDVANARDARFSRKIFSQNENVKLTRSFVITTMVVVYSITFFNRPVEHTDPGMFQSTSSVWVFRWFSSAIADGDGSFFCRIFLPILCQRSMLVSGSPRFNALLTCRWFFLPREKQ
jgi:hypothetical protein